MCEWLGIIWRSRMGDVLKCTNKWFLHGLDTLAFLLLFCNFLSKLCIWSKPVNLWKAELGSEERYLYRASSGDCCQGNFPIASGLNRLQCLRSTAESPKFGPEWEVTGEGVQVRACPSCGEIADRSCVQRDTGLLLEILGDWCSWGVFVSVGKGCLNFPGEALSWTWAIAMGGVSICVRGAEHAI